MEVRFISKLYYFSVGSNLNKGIHILEDVRVSNSNYKVKNLFGDPFFQSLIGKLEYEALQDCTYIYATGSVEEKLGDRGRIELVDQYLRICQHFRSGLWLIKDNSVNNESGFIYMVNEDNQSVTSNMRTSLILNSFGEYEKVEFSDYEVKKAINITNSIFGNAIDDIKQNKDDKSSLYNSSSRIERFFYFLQCSRAQEHLPNRIALYCTALESLLSTETTEITHKISERAAKILGSNFDERLRYFETIKDAYSIRSSNVHGDKLRKNYRDVETQRNISKELDDILRKLILYIIEHDEICSIYSADNNAELNAWFEKLILG